MKSVFVVLCLTLALVACTKTNHAPQITQLSATPSAVNVGGTSTLKVAATDADNDSLTYTWGSASGTLSATSGDSVVWTAPNVEGAYSVSVVADDGKASDVKVATIGVGTVPKMYVNGFAHYSESWPMLATGSRVQLLSDPLATGVTVSVGGRQLRPWPTPEPGILTFSNETLPTPGTQQDFSLTCNLGSCAATCTVPGGFAYSPAPVETLPVRTTLVLSWTQSSSANWYQVWASYTWYDTTYWSKDTVFTVTSTSAAIPGTWFTGDGWVYVDVYAGNGPSPAAASGSAGNVTGSAKGFWVGLNSIEADVTIGAGRKAAGGRTRSRPRVSPSRWFDLYTSAAAWQRQGENRENLDTSPILMNPKPVNAGDGQ